MCVTKAKRKEHGNIKLQIKGNTSLKKGKAKRNSAGKRKKIKNKG